MKLKSFITVLVGITALVSSANAASQGEELFQSKCSMCHVVKPPKDMSTLVAPPVFGVMRHVKMTYSNEAEALAFMRSYVMEPSAAKAVCMPQKLKKFGLMPSQKGNVTPQELEVITKWMYDNFPPKGFKGGKHKMF